MNASPPCAQTSRHSLLTISPHVNRVTKSPRLACELNGISPFHAFVSAAPHTTTKLVDLMVRGGQWKACLRLLCGGFQSLLGTKPVESDFIVFMKAAADLAAPEACEAALGLPEEMRRQGLPPSDIVYILAINILRKLGRPDATLVVYEEMAKQVGGSVDGKRALLRAVRSHMVRPCSRSTSRAKWCSARSSRPRLRRASWIGR